MSGAGLSAIHGVIKSVIIRLTRRVRSSNIAVIYVKNTIQNNLYLKIAVYQIEMADVNDNSPSSVTSSPSGANFLSIQQYRYGWRTFIEQKNLNQLYLFTSMLPSCWKMNKFWKICFFQVITRKIPWFSPCFIESCAVIWSVVFQKRRRE